MHELSAELIPLAEAEVKRCRGIKGAIGPAQDMLRQAKALGNKSRVDAALSVAQTLRPGMTIQRGVFDSDKRALAVENGVLLLEPQKARLVPPDRSQFMLRNTNVPYIPGAVSDAWEDFLDKFVDDDDMEDFLQRMAGYTLLGSNDDNLMFIFQGETGSGKTTFVKAISAALGDYAKPFDLGALRGKLSADAPREDIASIMHARLAHAAEMASAFTLHADQVKRMSGADEIAYRHLFEGMTSHVPDFTPWISSNFAPRIKGSDTALQRRLIGVPFLYPLGEGEEKSSKGAALWSTPDARASVLAWVVAGYDRYREVGLSRQTWPVEVERLTDELRRSLDVEDAFVTEMCIQGEEYFQPVADLWPAYESWCMQCGIKDHMSKQQFAEALHGKGFKATNKRIEGVPTAVRMGLKLQSNNKVKHA